jgi:hypothetical protein
MGMGKFLKGVFFEKLGASPFFFQFIFSFFEACVRESFYVTSLLIEIFTNEKYLFFKR